MKMYLSALCVSGLLLSAAFAQEPAKGEPVFQKDQPVIDFAKPIAVVNGITITQGQMEATLAKLNPQTRTRVASPEGKKDFIDYLVNQVLLEQVALKKGLDKDPEVASEIAVSQRQLLFTVMMEKEIQNTTVSDEQIKKWYSENLSDLMQPETVRARHILVKDEKTAKKVQGLLKKKDAKFEELAAEYSIEPGAKESGGDLNYFAKGQMVPEFEKVAFSLKVGEISDIVKTQFGYHIIKLEDKKAAGPIPLETIKEQVTRKLKFDNYIAPLKKDAKIEIIEEKKEESKIK
jgi:peptidyl-prolyl cis-trans isomerase C